MAKRNEIVDRYSQAAQRGIARDQNLYPAEYMLATNPGANRVQYRGKVYYSRYKNADSAGRAFRKLKSGETSGERMYARSELYPVGLNKGRDLGYEMRKPLGGHQKGLWKVTVFMAWTDQGGNEHGRITDDDGEDVIDYGSLEQRSFIVESSEFFNIYDAKSVEYEVADAIDDHVADWEDGYGVSNVSVVYVEVVPIQTYHVHANQVTMI